MADNDANVGAADGIVIDDLDAVHVGGGIAVDDSQSARRFCGIDMANNDADAVWTSSGFDGCLVSLLFRGDSQSQSTHCSVTRTYSRVVVRSLEPCRSSLRMKTTGIGGVCSGFGPFETAAE
jgi:hypothetical protein